MSPAYILKEHFMTGTRAIKATLALLMAILMSPPLLADIPSSFGTGDYFCRRAASPITVDGDLAEWRAHKALPLMLVAGENIVIPSWRGPDDLTVIGYFLWDDQYLYFAAEVTDDVHHDSGLGGGMYHGDGFQMAFDPLDDTLIPGYDGNDVEFGVGAADGRAAAYGWVGGKTGISGEIASDVMPIAHRRDEDAKRGTWEAAIPWKMLAPFAPSTGGRMGFNIIFNENDGDDEGRRGWVMWTPGIAEEKLSWLFRNMVLVEPDQEQSSPILTTDRRYYDDGQTVNLFAYVPWQDEPGEAQARLTVCRNGETVHEEARATAMTPGVTRIDFAWDLGRVSAEPAEAQVAVQVAGRSEPIIMTAPVFSLNVAMLKERADQIDQRNRELRAAIAQADRAGIDTSYPRVTAATTDIFLKYRRADLDNADLLDRIKPLAAISRQFDFLDEAVLRATREVEDLVAHPEQVKKLPSIDMTDLVIKHGTFHKGDMPVMLFGPLGWWTVFNDLDLVAEMGFNFVSGTTTPETMVPAPGKTRNDYLRSIAGQFDKARRLNMAVDYLPSPHPMPDGWIEAYPDIKDFNSNGWMGVSLYHPGARRMVEEFWNHLIPALCDKPALCAWDLVNEWSFSDGEGKIHPTMLTRFHNHLRQRYRTVEMLNRVWKTHYKTFDQIDPLAFDPSRDVGPIYDWQSFRNAEATDVMLFMKQIIRRYDPTTPCHVKIIATTDLNPEHFGFNGVERERIDDVLEISGCDCGQPMHFDFYKSLHPAKPSIDSEVHIAVSMTADEMRSTVWDAFLHGQSARLMFAWENAYNAEHLAAGAMLHIPWAMEAAGRTALDLRRLAPEIVAFQQAIPTAQVGLLFSQPSMILDRTYPPALRTTYSAFFCLDAPVRFISERQVRDGGLSGLKLLIVPNATFIEAETFEKVAEFARSGGVVLASPKAMSRDPYDNPHPEAKLEEAGVRRYEKPTDGLPAFFDAAMTEAGVERPLRPALADGTQPPSVEFRSIDRDGRILAYAINHSMTDYDLTFAGDRKVTKVRELISQRDLSLPIKVRPRDPMILAIDTDVKTAYEGHPHFECGGTADPHASGGQAAYRPENDGIYCWWALQHRLEPGVYKAIVRARAEQPGTFGLMQVNHATDQRIAELPTAIKNADYQEIELGEITYDGAYPLRLSDWSAPGLWIDYLYLTPIRTQPRAVCYEYPADDLTGWNPVGKSTLGLDAGNKKQGQASIRVTIESTEGPAWADGVSRGVGVDRAAGLSLWIFWETEPCKLYFEAFSADGSRVVHLDPQRYNARKGQWSLIELPAAFFSGDETEFTNLRTLAIGRGGQAAPSAFLIDDLRFDPISG